MATTRQATGIAGEELVARWYEDQGYAIVDRNWYCSHGELDLIARRGRVTVFCEVKTRNSDAYGAPEEAVTQSKQWKLRRTATRWLTQASRRAGEIRFDVAAVTGSDIVVIEDAF